jgi:hypothetical protein
MRLGWPCGFRGLIAGVAPALLSCLLLTSAHGQVDAEDIPPFRPPKGELPPSFWEQHGLWLILGIVALLALAVLVWRILANRPPAAPPTPAETARAALARLNEAGDCRPESAPLCATHRAHRLRSEGARPNELPDQVSAILRAYFIAVLELPIPQLTNRELAAELRSHSKLKPELGAQAGAFLWALDQHRFDPDSNAPLPEAVQTAMTLVNQTEAALRPPAPEPTATTRPTA